ncbi:MAG TPA: hypothetical protein DIW30_01440 [Bacteroidales bacterium]|nr:hypothetical protein [Bacteroidales bacterium]
MLVPTYAMLLLCIYIAQLQGGVIPSRWYVTVVTGTFVLTCLIPFSALLLLWGGDIKKAYMHDKESRRIPYVYGTVSAISWCLFLRFVLGMPRIINMIATGATISLLCIFLINYRWKISAHLTMMGVLLGGVLAYCLYMNIFPYMVWTGILIASWIVMWARLYLNEHAETEVTGGYLLGLTVTFLAGIGGVVLF